MKKAIGLGAALVVAILLVVASPASASSGSMSRATADMTHEAPYDADDGGVDGTDTATFVALALGGMALMAALAALVMGRSRPPA